MMVPTSAFEDLARKVDQLLERPAASAVDLAGLGLEPLRVYEAKEVARLLGTNRVSSVYEIPEDELPRVRRIGSTFGYLGINVLAYMLGKPPVDMEAVYDQYRERLMQDRPNVRPLRPTDNGKTRVL